MRFTPTITERLVNFSTSFTNDINCQLTWQSPNDMIKIKETLFTIVNNVRCIYNKSITYST